MLKTKSEVMKDVGKSPPPEKNNHSKFTVIQDGHREPVPSGLTGEQYGRNGTTSRGRNTILPKVVNEENTVVFVSKGMHRLAERNRHVGISD